MWELDHEEDWVLKNWCFWIVVLEKTLENPLDCQEIKPVSPKGNQPHIFIGRTDAEAETPLLCNLMQRANSLQKNLMLEKVVGRRRRGRQRMRWLDGITYSMDMNWHELEQTLGDGEAWRAAVHGHDWAVEQQEGRNENQVWKTHYLELYLKLQLSLHLVRRTAVSPVQHGHSHLPARIFSARSRCYTCTRCCCYLWKRWSECMPWALW